MRRFSVRFRWKSRQIMSVEDEKSEAIASRLEGDRAYLMLIAAAELDSDLQIKSSQSDVVQQSLLEAERSIGNFRGTSQHQWLTAILKNNVNDLRRRYIKASKRDIRREAPSPDANGQQHPGATETPSQLVSRKEQVVQLTESIAALPEHYQKVLRMRFWDQASYDEIAVHTGSCSRRESDRPAESECFRRSASQTTTSVDRANDWPLRREFRVPDRVPESAATPHH